MGVPGQRGTSLFGSEPDGDAAMAKRRQQEAYNAQLAQQIEEAQSRKQAETRGGGSRTRCRTLLKVKRSIHRS